jgi:hypothetical protein
MICNIRDSRKRPNRWKNVSAMVEPSFADNNIKDSDKAPRDKKSCPFCAEFDGGPLSKAIAWANSFEEPVTLYIYDAG